MQHDSMIGAAAAALAAVSLATYPALSGIVSQIRRREPRDAALYEDGDGKTTPEAAKAFSAKLPKTVLVLAALLGCGASLAVSLWATLAGLDDGFFVENWLATASSVLLLIQAASIAAIHKTTQTYTYGLYAFFSGGALVYVALTEDSVIAQDLLATAPLALGLRAVEAVALLTVTAVSVLLPRRPDVFYQDELVDRRYGQTAFSRFTFGWPSNVIALSAKKKNLDLVDLPRPDHLTRALNVSNDWKQKDYPVQRLWLSIARAHAASFALQWFVAFAISVVGFAPQWVILHFLRILETRTQGERLGIDVWIWVLWLGVAILAQSLLENYIFWLSWADISLPVRAQLSALIFEKSLRRKDVKSTKKVKADDKNDTDTGKKDDKDDKDTKDDDELEAAKKTKQGTVNLIGVDGKRVADFCSFQFLFATSSFKMIVSIIFLVELIGWIPLLAGFSLMFLIMPANIFFSNRYSEAQDRLMKLRDEKLAVVTEALQGIRQIKFSALEPQWEAKIGEVRDRELKSVWRVFMFDTGIIACWITSPIVLSAACLVVYALLHGELTPSVAFVSLGIFRGLEATLSVIPELATDLLDAIVSVKRLEDYLSAPDIERVAVDSDSVVFENATIAWPSDEKLDDKDRFVLRDLNIAFPPGELSVISGKTGSGKSLILAAILGEIDLLAGTLHVPHSLSIDNRHDDKANKANWILPKSIAYIAQIPWIENATVRNNILFGLPLDEDRYRKTLHACALTKDLEMFSDGENTEIGANGINLSGGQKWRITLARAIYSRAGILVMDDIFSAVDAHVGRHIYEKCINGELCAGRTRILVTHHVTLCAPKTKFLVELGNGGILHAGLLTELAQQGILDQIKKNEQTADEIHEDETVDTTAVNSDNSTDSGEDPEHAPAPHEHDDDESAPLIKSVSQALSERQQQQPSSSSQPQQAGQPQAETRKFVEEEKRETGAVRSHVYAAYMKVSGGGFYWLAALVLFITEECTTIGRSWWLRVWTGHYEGGGDTSANATLGLQAFGYPLPGQQPLAASFFSPGMAGSTVALPMSSSPGHGVFYYVGVYVAVALSSAILGSLSYFYVYFGSIKASKRLFAQMNFIILRSPLRWLDTVPVGRVLNRFTADFTIIDSQLANSLSFGSSSFIHVFGVVAAGLMVSSFIVLVSMLLLLVCLYFAFSYIAAVRPVKRLESTAKSPVFEQFGTALSGVSTIRGFNKERIYIERMHRRLDDWSSTTWHMILFNRWVSWRMSFVGSIFAIVVASLVLASPHMDSALAGFALTYALDFSVCVMWAVRQYANAEMQMNAAERIIEYTELPTESLEGAHPPAAWPTEGRIEVDNLVVSYASDLPPVLKGLTFSVDRGQRVGVVGRTGAGKSSLTLALFRFLEAQSGSIHVDGLDISKITLHDLRSRLAIIPQDPVLFSGTVRSNLDPFDTHGDDELRDCLQRVHLTAEPGQTAESSGQTAESSASSASLASTSGTLAQNSSSTSSTNANIFEDLQSPISEGGLNLSQGQRQLLCLARAIVRRPRVMVLDEATSAVDMHTDGLIQRSIREEFTGATLLVIAHRLSTIADFDRILVLKDGEVAEYGSPRELWEKGPEEGIFRGMCEESGDRDGLEKVVLG